jgi:hypothetical protein
VLVDDAADDDRRRTPPSERLRIAGIDFAPARARRPVQLIDPPRPARLGIADDRRASIGRAVFFAQGAPGPGSVAVVDPTSGALDATGVTVSGTMFSAVC